MIMLGIRLTCNVVVGPQDQVLTVEYNQVGAQVSPFTLMAISRRVLRVGTR